MQENDSKDLLVLVKANLLLEEIGFDSLRNCISKLNYDDIELYQEFEYDFDKEEVVAKRCSFYAAPTNLVGKLFNKIQKEDFILISFDNLKKFLSI